MRELCKRILNPNKKETHLRVRLFYSKGGWNVFTSKSEQRGYYISLQPVTREGGFESFIAFSGCKVCVKEVKRASKKAEAEADAYFDEHWMEYVKRNFNYELES